MTKPIAAILVLALCAPAFAQNPNPDVIEKEGQKPKQAQSQQEQAAEASSESSKYAATGADVSYEQILANPDDLELNYRYALGQIKRGELKGASATLERILLINPNLPKVRLLYGAVLLRLDNLSESDRVLDQLIKSNPPAGIKTEAEQYLAEARKLQKRTQLSGRLAAGFEYDDNRNATPSNDKRLFGGTEIQLTGANERRDDTAQVYMANLEVHHDLGSQGGHEVFATANYYRTEQTLVKILNLQAYSLGAGGVYRSHWADITPTLLFDHVLLAQTTFLRDHGASLRLDKKINRKLSVWGEFRDVMQQYQRTAVVATAPERDGLELDWTVEADYIVDPKLRVGFNYTHGLKRASRHYFSYMRDGAGANAVYLLGKGTFLLGTGNVYYDQYQDPDLALTSTPRRDTITRVSATYGAPLTLLNRRLKDVVFTFTYEWYWAQSTVENYAYTNNKLLGLLTYKWSLGL